MIRIGPSHVIKKATSGEDSCSMTLENCTPAACQAVHQLCILFDTARHINLLVPFLIAVEGDLIILNFHLSNGFFIQHIQKGAVIHLLNFLSA